MLAYEKAETGLGVSFPKLTTLYFSSKNAKNPSNLQGGQADRSSVDFLSVAVGERSDFIEDIVLASCSKGLRAPPRQIGTGVAQTNIISLHMMEVFKNATSPHVVSIALTKCPNRSESNVAARLCCEFQEQGSFVLITGPDGVSIELASLGSACDCIVEGDCSAEHHSYPARTIADPIEGRMICYELLDVLNLWAGRVGRFNSQLADLDALHIEISPSVGCLADIDGMAMRLRHSNMHKVDELTSVVPMEACKKVYMTSFQRSALISQAYFYSPLLVFSAMAEC